MPLRLSLAAATLLWVLGCRSNVDPDQGMFTCQSDADCGAGYSCRPQSAGGGRCHPSTACSDAESCNGLDDDCDGEVDEDFPGKDEACSTGLAGVCAAGKKACQHGQEQCQALAQASAELCDALDNDCDGAIDEDFDLNVDEAHCGACQKACGAGSACLTGTCREVSCADSADNDSDGDPDCQDPDCAGQTCEANNAQLNCGASLDGGLGDGGAGDGGSTPGCVARETTCDDGADNDGDGWADCLDPDCDTLACGPGTSCQNLLCPGAG